MKPQTPSAALDGIMTRHEVAAWLKVAPRQLDRLGVPCLDLGRKTKRYVVKDVSAWLDSRRKSARVGARGTVGGQWHTLPGTARS